MDGQIRVVDVEKYYGTKRNITRAVNRVSFNVEKGEFLGIMGASGSGKTTLLNMMSTIDRVTAGHIYYGETDITSWMKMRFPISEGNISASSFRISICWIR